MSREDASTTSTSSPGIHDAGPAGKPPRRPAPTPSQGEREFRLSLTQTGGRVVHVWDHDVASVKEVTTRNGDCLLAEVRGGEPLWLVDDPANRSALSLRRPRGSHP